jgi:GT2 family glycosyltransferase
MKKVFAITVNYNKDDSTRRLLKSFENINTQGFELSIIVVDNGTKKEFNLDEPKKNITVLRPGSNTGFAGGSNIGMREALKNGADYILLANNDTFVDSEMVVNLLNVLEKREKTGIAAPKIYFEKGREFHKSRYSQKDLGNVIWYAGGFIDWKNGISVHRGVDEVDKGQYDTAGPTDFSTGCCMMIKKEVLEKIGLFDENYFLYYEDADLCQRLKKAGYDIYYVPSAFMYHENASSSGSGSPLHDYFLTRNQMLFGMKYAPLRTKIALIRQSLKLLLAGRADQKRGIGDYYMGRLGKGTYFEK